ncbi:MAG TPA: response regulator [Pseudomonadota bacterium]|nr:response regulator [Pseudomonadota bacterium]
MTTEPERPQTILLVDDDIHNQKIFETVLRHSGFRVRMAANGEEALREARADLPDLILMDLSIPVIDGWECSRQLKADAATRHITILALTAHAMRGDQERALAAGCDGYLSKPISPKKLVEEVKARLKHPL